MAKGPDELVEFILEEIALCGAQGAGSADFRRFIQQFHKENRSKQSEGDNINNEASTFFHRRYYELVWEWVQSHDDVRIVYGNEQRSLSLTEFEAFELQETGTNGADYNTEQHSPPSGEASQSATTSRHLSKTHTSLRDSLRDRLAKEGHTSKSGGAKGIESKQNLSAAASPIKKNALASVPTPAAATANDRSENQRHQSIERPSQHRGRNAITPCRTGTPIPGTPRNPHRAPRGVKETGPVFDDIPTSTTAPRIYVSQDRTWRAVAGHPVDLKKLSAMQFILLSIIAAHGPDGIYQPDLVRISGQDKRSVPHRTDELAKAGYIEKTPVTLRGLRTSLCVHKRFVKEGHFLRGSSNFEDVFRNRGVILSSLVDHLYNILKETPLLRYTQLRTALGVSVQDWNTRGIRTAVRRLEETGFLERKRVLRKGNQKGTTVVIRLLRPPNPDDVKNLSFRRKPVVQEQSAGVLEDDEEGDDLMRDLELDLDFNDDELENDRIPPQWDPDRLFPNLAYEAIALAGMDGTDASKLREKTMGKFWKRPTESFISRLTDNWELSQPPHLRHLALIRDTTVTNEKKLVHYVYRTYPNFQEAVDAGQVAWEAVSREALKNSSAKGGRAKKSKDEDVLDKWGFHVLDASEFHLRHGQATLSECNAAIVVRRRNGPRWDIGLTEMIKQHKRRGASNTKSPVDSEVDVPSSMDQEVVQSSLPAQTPLAAAPEPTPPKPKPKPPSQLRRTKQLSVPLLSAEQRIALKLPPRGRLGNHIESQIRDHREKTGDPTSLPDVIYTDPADIARLKLSQGSQESRPAKKAKEPRLFTKAFRKAHGLPEHGKLPQDVIDRYRQMEVEGTSGFRSTEVASPALSGVDASQQPEPEPGLIPPTTPAEQPTPADEVQAANSMPFETGTESTPPSQEAPVEGMGSTNDKPTSNRLPVGKKRPGAELERPPGALKKLAMDTADRSSPVVGGTSPGDEAAAPSIPESPILSSVETATGTSKAVKKSIPGRVTKSTKVKLPPGAEAVVQKFTERSEPGVYINPYALRPISRGRPKKAYMAVFKSSRLNEFHWFLPEIDPNPPKPKRRKRLPSHRTEAPEPQAELLSQADTANTEPVDEDMGEDLDVDDTHVRTSPEDNHATVTPVPEESSRDRSQGDSRDDTALHHPPPSSHYLTHATWSAVNAPHRPPYQNASQVTSAPQSAEVDVEMAGVSRTGEHAAEQGDSSSKESVPAEASLSEDQVASNPNATADETRSGAVHLDKAPAVEVAPHSKPNDATPTSGVISLGLSAFTHKRRKKHGAFAKRGVVLGRGNVWRRRTLIVQDILEQCHGVFPFNGEIVAPFFTLWDKGTLKKMSRPDRTTITNTINNMIEDPDCNIRKLVFRIPGIEGKSTVDRFIIARKDIPTNDPRIKALQQNMIKVYPHKYYPEEIRHLVGPEAPHRKIRVPEFDPTISADGQVPSAYHKLDQRILSSAQTRRRRVAGNATKDALSQQPGYRRQRLESLHGAAKSTRGRLGADGAPLHEYRIRSARDGSPASSTSSETSYSGSSTSSDDDRSDVDADFSFEPRVAPEDGFFNLGPTEYKWQSRSTIFSRLLDPPVQFYPNSGTFSTDFGTYPSAVVRGSDRRSSSAPTEVGKEGGWQFIGGWKFIIEQPPFPRSKKRVRFTDAHGEGPRKKRRLENATGDSLSSDGPVSNRGTLKILDPNMNLIRRKPRKQLPQGPAPTLAERLVGHTGNPDDPVYIAPRKKKDHRPRRWTHMKPPEERKEPVPRKPVEILEPGDAFKKMFCALTVASCMCGEEDSVDWTIVAKVYRIDRRFDLEKAKKLWRWIRRNMAEQLQALKSEFQSKFLTAYEKGHIDDIEDPETYDWESLVKWTMKKCEYAQPALPPAREDLHDYDVTESGYRGFSRIDWAQKALAHVIRAQRVLKYAYAAPLHDKPTMPPVDDDLRARSWIRANTATAQDVYNSNVAYNKLQVLGGTMLERTVAELCQLRMIKQRKLKRLLPGRNYDFTATFALKYRRAFDQTVFIDAVEFKKHLDAAFSNPNPEQRFLPVSRTANDGAVMALLSLVCAGKVRLIPKLPPVNNELQAPTPRLSIWGFMEGDYVHRKIDRNRLFWDVHAVPTEDYPFGNPLRPSPKPDNEHDPIEWRPVPEPPLPGKHDPNAPLPIWSSIDGHHVTWPWWYRILNLVLQGIMFQPGVSVHETFSLCPQGTVELFEVELVLRWLVDAGAARETDEGTFIIESGFWAAFGESLVGTENDWFGDHVKRNKMPEMRQPWRKVFNLRSERVDALMRPGGPEGGVGMGVDGDSLFVPEGPAPPSQNGLGESEGEGGGEVLYAFSHLQRPGRKRKRRADRPGDGIGVVIGSASVGLSAQTGVKDVVMRDSDSGGESEEEDDDGPDAEGEMDYEML